LHIFQKNYAVKDEEDGEDHPSNSDIQFRDGLSKDEPQITSNHNKRHGYANEVEVDGRSRGIITFLPQCQKDGDDTGGQYNGSNVIETLRSLKSYFGKLVSHHCGQHGVDQPHC
jgi:hypothetical protein